MKMSSSLPLYPFFLSRLWLRAALLFIIFCTPALPAKAEPADCHVQWEDVGEGLELGFASFAMPEGVVAPTGSAFVLLRIHPEKYEFSLQMASEDGGPHSLKEWAQRHNLRAGINAGMYLKDRLTNTGLMRSPSHENNSRIGSRLGAFFVSGPLKKGLPKADILEHDSSGWKKKIESYGYIVQNFRLVDGKGNLLWPEGGAHKSIAAVMKDEDGRIIFIICQMPMTANDFARLLGRLQLGSGPVMYVEGGAQAGLFLKEDAGRPPRPGATAYQIDGGVVQVWKGRQSIISFVGNPDAPLPNIIGIADGFGE